MDIFTQEGMKEFVVHFDELRAVVDRAVLKMLRTAVSVFIIF